MKRNRLQTKIAVWAGVCLVVTAIGIIGYAAWTMIAKAELNRQEAIQSAKNYAVSVSRQYASRAKAEFETALDTARTLADILSGVNRQGNGLELDRDEVNGILRNLLEENAQFVGIYAGWEPNAFDAMDLGHTNEAGYDATGRFIPYWGRTQDGIITVEPLIAYDQEGAGNYYLLPKQTKQECIIDPYTRPVQGVPTLLISLIVPILADNAFYGIVGIDLGLEVFQPIADDQNKIYDDTAEILIVSHKGTLVAVSHQPNMAGKHLEETGETDVAGDLPDMQAGAELIEIEDEHLEITTPLTVGATTTPWAVKMFIPLEKITDMADAQRAQAFLDIWRMIGISVLCTLLALGVLWLVARSITRPIVQVVTVAERLAEGQLHLEIDVQSTDEIGQLQRAMKLMIEQLRGFALSIKKAAEQVADGSQAINATASQMSHGAATQAAAAEEASSSMEEMAANIRQNADNAMQTEQIATQASADARESGRAVNEAVAAMQEIAKKIAMIEDITRQTRMLSLNATIEAARAHEQGRGFAVVAAEVRALSERSQAAANEITELTRSSVAIADRAGNMLRKLVPDIQKTAELVQEISAASKEQDAGAGQINRAIQQLDQVTQQNAATSEEMAAMAEELAAQSEQLQAVIAFFKIDDLQREQPETRTTEITNMSSSGKQPHTEKAFIETPPIRRVNSDVDVPARDARDDEFERY